MNSTDNIPIYQNGITLSSQEEQVLTQKAWDQSRIIAKILKNREPEGFTTYEMFHTLENLFGEGTQNIHSVKRAMSAMTGTKGAPQKYRDKEGRWPLVKLAEKRLNPETDTHIHLYAWNARYNKPLNHREILEKHRQNGGQMDFHKELTGK